MANRLERALADKDDSSRQISQNNRYISFGLVAITFALQTSDSPYAKAVVEAHPIVVLAVGAFGCLGVVFDYLHYACAVAAATNAIENKAAGHEHQYSKSWSSYKWRNRFFFLRTAAAVAGAIVLIALIVLSWFAFKAV